MNLLMKILKMHWLTHWGSGDKVMPDPHAHLLDTKFPDFSIYNDEGVIVTNNEIYQKWTVMFFYPKDDSPGCTLQSCSFRDRYEEFHNEGILLYGVSSDSIASHKRFKKKYNLQYSLLSDKESRVSKVLKLKKNFGMLNARVTFVINPKGVIVYTHTSQLGVTGHVNKALKAIKTISAASENQLS